MSRIVIVFILIIFQANSFAQDTIPFSIGKNNKIYIKAKINNSDELNFMYDTGANENAIKKSVLEKKSIVKIDGKQDNIGFGGVSTEETSSNNNIKINTISKTNQKLIVLDYENEYEDGIIGWTFFENKIVHINYGIRKIILYDQLPEIPKEYIKLKCKNIDNLFFVPLKLKVNGKNFTAWFELDTGSDGSLIVSNLLARKRQLLGEMAVVGSSISRGSDNHEIVSDVVLLDELRMKKYRFFRIPINVTVTESSVENNDILGNNFLKRFHIYMDFKQNTIYLKVNNLLHSPYIEELAK